MSRAERGRTAHLARFGQGPRARALRWGNERCRRAPPISARSRRRGARAVPVTRSPSPKRWTWAPRSSAGPPTGCAMPGTTGPAYCSTRVSNGALSPPHGSGAVARPSSRPAGLVLCCRSVTARCRDHHDRGVGAGHRDDPSRPRGPRPCRSAGLAHEPPRLSRGSASLGAPPPWRSAARRPAPAPRRHRWCARPRTPPWSPSG